MRERDTVSQSLIDVLDAKMKEYYMTNAIYKSKVSERSHRRASYEQEVRRVCTECPFARCELEGFPDREDWSVPTCERFERHFAILRKLAAHMGLRIDPAADGEDDSFFEFMD